MNVQSLLTEMRHQGITIEANGDHLVIDGPCNALSDEAIERLRAMKGELLALLCGPREEGDVDALGRIRGGLAKIAGHHGLSGYSAEEWQQVIRDGEAFLDRWGAEALRLGWTATDLFG